jgi:hypothetical protein
MIVKHMHGRINFLSFSRRLLKETFGRVIWRVCIFNSADYVLIDLASVHNSRRNENLTSKAGDYDVPRKDEVILRN